MDIYLDKIQVKTKILDQDNFNGQLNLLFDLSSSVIALGEITLIGDFPEIEKMTFGSNHWLSENSDFIRFNNSDLTLNSLILNLPDSLYKSNLNFNFLDNNFYQLLSKKKFTSFIYPPSKFKYFSSIDRVLALLYSNDLDGCTAIKLSNNFYILTLDGNHVGFLLKEPLSYLTSDYKAISNPNLKISNTTYDIFYNILDLLSKHKDNDQEIVANILNNEFLPIIDKIPEPEIKTILKTSISEFFDYFS